MFQAWEVGALRVGFKAASRSWALRAWLGLREALRGFSSIERLYIAL